VRDPHLTSSFFSGTLLVLFFMAEQKAEETTIIDDMMESSEPKLTKEERNARDGNFLEEVVIDQCDQVAAKVRIYIRGRDVEGMEKGNLWHLCCWYESRFHSFK